MEQKKTPFNENEITHELCDHVDSKMFLRAVEEKAVGAKCGDCQRYPKRGARAKVERDTSGEFDMWLCLYCHHIACGNPKFRSHSKGQFGSSNHAVTLAMQSPNHLVYCFICKGLKMKKGELEKSLDAAELDRAPDSAQMFDSKTRSMCSHIQDCVVPHKVASKFNCEEIKCQHCGMDTDLWVCLECGQISCGGREGYLDETSHISNHATENGHGLGLDIGKGEIWCSSCRKSIAVESIQCPEQMNLVEELLKNLQNNLFEAKELTKPCSHFDLPKLRKVAREKGLKAVGTKCQDCENRGELAKVEPQTSGPFDMWRCLECDHFGCGIPAELGSHSRGHFSSSNHAVVYAIQSPAKDLYCFICNMSMKEGELDNSPDSAEKCDGKMKSHKSPDSESCSMRPQVQEGSTHDLGKHRVLRGLKNVGNSCFFNVTMQSLLALEKVRSYFNGLTEVHDVVRHCLKRLVDETEPTIKDSAAIDPKEHFDFVCAFVMRSGRDDFGNGKEEDPHELLTFLFQGLSDADERFVEKNIEGEYSYVHKCLHCSGQSKPPEQKFLYLPICIKQSINNMSHPSVNASLEAHKGEVVTKLCLRCGQDQAHSVEVSILPKSILIFALCMV